jgi:prophage antirepressor-like protein
MVHYVLFSSNPLWLSEKFVPLRTILKKVPDMTKKQAIQLFEERKVRTVWDDEQEKWYFCVVDVVEILTESINPTDYIKKMKKRDPELAKGWGQIVTPLAIQTTGGKQKMNCATIEGIFRLIQSIPSRKAVQTAQGA